MKRKVTLAVAASVVALMPVMAQAANKLIVKDATGTVDKMVVTDSGFVGIGTNAPSTAIEISGPPGSIASRMLMRTSGAKSSSGGGGVISLHNNDSATNSSFPLKNDRLGFYLFGTKYGTSNVTSAGIEALAADNWTPPNNIPSYMRFVTGGSVRILIDTNGNTGFGTTTPTQRIEVNGGVKLNTLLAIPPCDTTSRGTIWFTQGTLGVADTLKVCAKDASNNYNWRVLY